jgi:hypothetical protein
VCEHASWPLTGDGTLEPASKAAPCTCTAAQIEHRSEHSHGKRSVGTNQGWERLSFSRLTTHYRARWGGTPRQVITSLSVGSSREREGCSACVAPEGGLSATWVWELRRHHRRPPRPPRMAMAFLQAWPSSTRTLEGLLLGFCEHYSSGTHPEMIVSLGQIGKVRSQFTLAGCTLRTKGLVVAMLALSASASSSRLE